MNSKTKRRMIVATGIIIIVLIAALTVISGSNSARTVTVAQAAAQEFPGKKIQVSGTVVDNSFATQGNLLLFSIFDPQGDANTHLRVSYEGGVSATFGNGVTAICTGKMDQDGILNASELVTKCPSKYETSTDVLTLVQLLDYGEAVVDKPVKVAGIIQDPILADPSAPQRFVLSDEQAAVRMPVACSAALPDGITAASKVVLTGSITSEATFVATDIALQKD